MFQSFQPLLNDYSGDERDRKFFMLLEETELFREFSMLLKIKNSSMVDFISINLPWFKEYKKNDVEAVNAYCSAKKKSKYDPIELKNKEGVIESNVNNFFVELASLINAKIDALKEADSNQFFKVKKRLYFDGNSERNTVERLAKIDSRLSSVIFDELPPQKPNPYEYQI